MDSPPLLCKNRLIEPQKTFKETNGHRIHSVEVTRDLEVILDDCKEVFEGIGCIQDKNTGEEIKVKLEIDPEAIPVAQKSLKITPERMAEPRRGK